MKVPAKTKMTMLKNPLAGNPLQAVERLGYTPKQYQAALDKTRGEKCLLQRHLETMLRASPVKESNLKEIEIFSDRLTDVVSALYIAGQQ